MYINIKRLMDVIISIILLLPFTIIFFIVGLLIKLEDGGPVFYNGERLGKGARIFRMYKFRTMKVNAPDLRNEDGSTFNSSSDPRLTKIGKILRETSIDEIPQLINVLKGDMSIIGPRASITGYTQAYFRNGISSREKRLNDVWYAKNINFCLDIKIFLKTIVTVFWRQGLYTNDLKSKLISTEGEKAGIEKNENIDI